jgi:TIR domain
VSRIFISYRRDDSGVWAGRLYDRLSQRFGRENAFMNIDTIDPGLDFVEVIQEAVGSCDALIAVIGRQWLTSTDAVGQRRLDNPEDFVRVEITAALKRNIRMIPVLVQGAPMPRSTDQPGVLQSLSRRNALGISETRFHSDVDRLIEVLEPVLRAIEVTATQPTSESPEAEGEVQTGEVRPPVR